MGPALMGNTNTDKSEWERFTKDKLIEGLKGNKYKKVVIMTGAGISVAAGIPDFRSPGTGLYDNLKEFELPSPESIFDIEFFKKKPEAFTKFAKEFLIHEDSDGVFLNQPKLTHKLVKYLSDNGLLYRYFTSNIENSEE